jgi:Ferredoxin-like domain in Api92-like protein
MPNHITNIFKITGPRNQINSIIGNSESDFTFKNTVPHPPEADNTDNSENSWDWYNWQINNWGTKWDAYETVFCMNDIDEDYAELNFQTAWSAPYEWLKSTIERFRELKFELYWLDEDYPNSGQYIASNGQFNVEEYYNSSQNIEEAKEFTKKHFPDTYDMYEREYKLNYLIDEINEVVEELHPNVQIRITDQKYDSDTESEEPVQFEITYIDSDTNSNIFNTLDKETKKEIIKKCKRIIDEHGYKTINKGCFLNVK